MELYLVEADRCDYGQYDSFVVWAESPDEALRLVRAEGDPRTMSNFDDNVKFTEIKKPKESGIVFGLFNAR